MVWSGVLWCVVIQCRTVWCGMVWCGIIIIIIIIIIIMMMMMMMILFLKRFSMFNMLNCAVQLRQDGGRLSVGVELAHLFDEF